MKSSSLFIGRFQPFHLGHLSDVKTIIGKGEYCIVAIAAANKSGTWRNPLTGGEREAIVKETLKAEGLNPDDYAVIQVADIDDDGRWVQHVIDSTPPFERIYSGSAYIREFYERDGRFPASELEMLMKEDGHRVSATFIREGFLNGEDMSKFMHPQAFKMVKALNFEDRLAKIKAH